MAVAKSDETVVGTRLSKPLLDKVVRRQQEIRKLTGCEPSIAAVLRAMVEEAPEGITTQRKRRVTKSARGAAA